MTTPDYHAAYDDARRRANASGLDVSIRGHREYGRMVYTDS
jgi:hypothetical protein